MMLNDDSNYSQIKRFLNMHSILGAAPGVVLAEFASDSNNDLRKLHAEIERLLDPLTTDDELLALVIEATDDDANPEFNYRDYLRRTLNILDS